MLHRLHGVLVYGANNFYMCKMPAGVGEKKLLHEARKKYGHFMHCTCLSLSHSAQRAFLLQATSLSFSDFNLPRIYEEQ